MIVIKNISTPGPNPNVSYNGRNLPAQKVPYNPPVVDQTNNPSRTLINGIQLPLDTMIFLNGEKLIVMNQILDGVVVYERILRKPYELEFEFVLRTQDIYNPGNYVFPQDDMANIWNNVWLPDSVVTVENTYLNKLGIRQMVIHRIRPVTVRGSKNLPVTISGYENTEGLSIIINS